jgi:Protein kinase domain/AAA ATPase domain
MSRSSEESASSEELVFAQRYRVVRLLGRGGMGSVYEVVDGASGRRMALKCLAESGRAIDAALFEREYRTLAGLHHRGIVEVYEFGTSDDIPFYTMELVEGEHLGKGVPLPVREACACLRDVAAIVGVLHARGLVHRDLSPRNLLRTPEGHFKLIDFGALAPFGPAREVVGTPPLLPPEALSGAPLDQRSDLFSLGALGYWLLTGSHAFPARQLSELPRLHQQPPALPSAVRARAANEPLAAELDALLLALLRVARDERPASTGELIDRLNAIAGLDPERHEANARGYLDSKLFVGRERECASVLAQLAHARGGKVSVLSIEAERGLGRTRLLHELAVAARLAGAAVVTLDARAGERPFAATQQLVYALLAGLPGEARQSARPYMAALAPVWPAGETRTAAVPEPAAVLARDSAIRLQLAICSWLSELARERLIVLFVDDLHALDEESRAVLASLARLDTAAQLLVVASSDSAALASPSPATQSLRSVANTLTLCALTEQEILQLLRSVFGSVPFLERSAERLFRVSAGHPAYCLELAEHLVRSGLARYQDGVWSLPTQLDEGALPSSRDGVQLERLGALSAAARGVAQALSLQHHGSWTRELAAEACERAPVELEPLLRELELGGVLRESGDGLVFEHEAVRRGLESELSPERRTRAHLRLGHACLQRAGNDYLRKLRAAIHLLRGGELARAVGVMTETVLHQDYQLQRQNAPLFQEAYTLLEARGVDAYARAAALTALCLASYHVDQRYARYAEEAIRCYERALHLPLAHRLRALVGGKLALIIALLCALAGTLRRGARSPSLRDLVVLCMRGSVSLTGMAGCCLDSRNARRYADTLSPFLALGDRHATSLACQLARMFAQGVTDRPAQSVAELGAMITRIERNEPIRQLTPTIRREALAGALFVYGANLCSRDDPAGLAVADRLDDFGPMYALSADHLRYNFYLGQGDTDAAEQARKRVELHAVRLGNAWQVETWAPTEAVKAALRTSDALMAKRAAMAFARLSPEIPSLALEERHARGSYLLLRGRHRDAIELLDSDEEPLLITGWARTRGALARCHNALGEHARAREICQDALARMSEGDLAFVVSNLSVQVELAHAEAGLGRVGEAAQQLDALLQRHRPAHSALTMGALHEARARVALRAGDLACAQEHVRAMDSEFRRTGLASLRDVVDGLRRELDRAGGAGAPVTAGPQGDLSGQLQLLLTQSSATTVSQRLSEALALTRSAAGADSVFVVTGAGESWGADASAGAPSELVGWAEQLLAGYAEDEQTELTEELTASDSHVLLLAETKFLFVPLWGSGAQSLPVAAMVLGFVGGAPTLPDLAALRVLARLVVGARANT